MRGLQINNDEHFYQACDFEIANLHYKELPQNARTYFAKLVVLGFSIAGPSFRPLFSGFRHSGFPVIHRLVDPQLL